MDKILIRPCQKGDEKKIVMFHEKACISYSSPEFWKWKYFENPVGENGILLAMKEGMIIGMIGGIPTNMQIGSKNIIAGQVMDLNILEEYRKNSLFINMERQTRKIILEKGLPFTFGFSNKITLRNRLDHLVSSVNMLIKPLDIASYISGKGIPKPFVNLIEKGFAKLLGWREKHLESEEVEIVEINYFDERFDDLWKDSIKGEIMVVRDSVYLNWRYIRCPQTNYKIFAVEKNKEILGYIVLQIFKKKGFNYGNIADFLIRFGYEWVMDVLLSKAIIYLKGNSVRSICCWIPLHSPFYPLLRGKGFWKRENPVALTVRLYKNEGLSDLLKDEKNWYYTIGDSDNSLIPRFVSN